MKNFFATQKIISVYTSEKPLFLNILFFLQSLLEIFTILIIFFLLNQILNVQELTFFVEYFNKKNSIYFLSLVTIIFLIISFLLNIVINFRIINFGYKIYVDIVSKLFKEFIKTDYINISSYTYSDVSSKILNETRRVCEFVIIPYYLIISKSIVLFFVLLGLIIYKPFNTLLVLLCVITLFSTFYFFTRSKIEKHGKLISHFDKEILSSMSNTFYGFKEIKLSNLTDVNLKHFVSSQIKMSDLLREIKFISNTARYGIEFFVFLFFIFSIIILNFQDNLNEKAFSLMGFYLFVIVKMLPYVNVVYLNLSFWKSHIESFKRIEDFKNNLLLTHKIDKKNNNIDKKINFSEISVIKLKKFQFFYPNDKKNRFYIKDIELKPKIIVGINGSSGSGKTTFLDLLSGLIIHNEKSGLYINNVKINYSNRNDYFNKISYVQQKVFLVQDTIRNNIILDSKFDEVLFDKAIKAAKADIFLLDKKYRTSRIEEKISFGRENLSGGQIQRIGIARAIYKNPEILILDEATNGLDNEIKIKVLENVLNYPSIKYIFISTHDNSIFKYCDKIIKIENREIYLQ